jgi:DNA repair protein RadD
MAGEPENQFAQVHVASVQTLARRGNPANADWLTVIDECHHATASSYASLFGTGSPVVGLTATPFRLDGAGLGDLFGSMVVAATSKDLVDRGILIRPRVLCAPAPDLSKARVVGGDYSITDAAAAMDTSRLVGDAVATWLARAAGRRTIVFATSIDHSRHIAAAFLAAGVPAAHVDGETEITEREEVLRKLRSGELLVVSNVGLFTEGWDLPALECCIMAKPTASLALHQQMAGRVVRIAEGKGDAIILDHAGNHHRHGEIVRELEYSLETKVVSKSGPMLGVRTCLGCYCMFPVTTWVCPQCGLDSRPKAPPIQHEPGDLRDYVDHAFDARAAHWAKLEEHRRALGFPETWSVDEYRRAYGAYPVIAFGHLVDPPNATLDERADVWGQIDVRRIALGYDRGWSDHQYKAIFGRWPSPDVRTGHAKERVAAINQKPAAAARQWTGRAKVSSVHGAPSRPGPATNPYAGQASESTRRPWESWRSPARPSSTGFETAEAAAVYLLEMAGLFGGEIRITDVVDNVAHRKTVYRAAAIKCHPDRLGGSAELMTKINQARDYLDENDIPF